MIILYGAVSITDNYFTKKKEIIQFLSLKSAVYNQERVLMGHER